MKTLFKTVMVMAAFVFAVSCGKKDEVKLVGNEWKLTTMYSADETFKVEANNPTIAFSDTSNMVYGFGGCNRFFGNYKVADAKLQFSQMGSTMMMCPRMDTEDMFMHVLSNARSYKIQNKELQFFDSVDVKMAVLTLVEKTDAAN